MTIIQKYQEVRDEPNDNITESDSFKSRNKISGKTPDNNNIKNVETAEPL